jgi:hypothetical protein
VQHCLATLIHQGRHKQSNKLSNSPLPE